MAWTKVPKPTQSTSSGNTPIAAGFFLFLTYPATTVSDWTDVPKPTSSTWSAVAKPSTVNWTDVPKPIESSITTATFGQGTPIGLLLALTQSTSTTTTSIITGWTDISKPTSSVWTIVPKPTT